VYRSRNTLLCALVLALGCDPTATAPDAESDVEEALDQTTPEDVFSDVVPDFRSPDASTNDASSVDVLPLDTPVFADTTDVTIDTPRPPMDTVTTIDTPRPTEPRVELAANELRFIHAIYPPYLHAAARYDAARARAATDQNELNNYSRAMCSLALMSLIDRRATGAVVAQSDGEVTWLIAAANDFAAATDIAPSNPFWWIEPTAGFDCLVASSLVRDVLPAAAHNTLVRSAASLAQGMMRDPRFTVANYEFLQTENRGNSQAEEVGVAASYLTAAYYLLPDALAGVYTATDRAAWLTRAASLATYGARDTGTSSPFQTGQRMVANHQMSPHPVYTQSLLTSYGEIAMVARQMTPGMPVIPPLELGLPDARWTDAVTAAVTAQLTPEFAVTGSFDLVDRRGMTASTLRYDDLRATVANFPPGWRRLIPTQAVGAISTTYDTLSGTTRSYQYRDARVWNYTCTAGRCDAGYNRTMAEQWSSVTGQATFGTTPLPTDTVDAVAQYFETAERLRTFLYRGDRLWNYDCTRTATGPFACAAQYTRTLAAQLATVGGQSAWSVPAPTADLDAASQYRDATTGGVRAYFFRANRVWHFRCEPTCSATYTRTLAELWAGVGGTTAYGTTPLPTDRIDAMTQFYDATNSLVTYVYRDDRVWKYTCIATGCTANFTNTLDGAWSSVANQQRWATSIFSTRTGMIDWGFDASIQNSAYAWAAARSATNVANYRMLQAAQLRQGRATHPYLPPRNVMGTWSWGDFDQTFPGRMLTSLTDGWRVPGIDGVPSASLDAPTREEQVNSHWWINALDGYNHAVAFLLLTDRPLLQRFDALR
jgi:hypothetical protein